MVKRELASLIAVQLVGLLGLALLLVGIYQMHKPAAFIVGGGLILVWAVVKSSIAEGRG